MKKVLESRTKKNAFIECDVTENSQKCESSSRRNFLTRSVPASVVMGSGVMAATFAPSADAHRRHRSSHRQYNRQIRAKNVRVRAAKQYLKRYMPPQERNNDEMLYDDRRAVFGKTLRHNGSTFETLKGSYDSLVVALESGAQEDYDNILRAGNAERQLLNPQAANSFDLTGGDAHQSRISPAPDFAGAQQAAEMAELYWQALTRDVPFSDFDSDELIADACTDLKGFSESVAPVRGGDINPQTIFRGVPDGPYVSQFLLQDIPYGPYNITQRIAVPVEGRDFIQTSSRWLRIQRGRLPNEELRFNAGPRYIYSQRALGEYVRKDLTAQAYTNAALIMLGYGQDALAASNPYLMSLNEEALVTFGETNILDLIGRAATIAMKTAWYQKWLVHRRLRPEVFAMRVARQNNGTKDYDIHPELMNSFAVFLAAGNNSENLALLPQAYPEGSPVSPSYPSAHACVAGACSLVLKAFFDTNFVMPETFVASRNGTSLLSYNEESLTLGAEIDKLATNMCFGRNAAGVTYRSDCMQGIIAGEQVAARLLQDVSLTYSEDFDGFNVTRFNGSTFSIKNGVIRGRCD